MRCLFEREGFDVRAYKDTSEALEILDRPADIVVLNRRRRADRRRAVQANQAAP
jgi:hypothetical protein